MKVMLAIPRHRSIDPPAEMWAVEAVSAILAEGWEVLYADPRALAGCYEEEARETACNEAINQDCDALVMCDSDQYLSGEETVELVKACLVDEYAFMSVPYPIRNRAAASWDMAPESAGGRLTVWEKRELKEAIENHAVLKMGHFAGTGTCCVNIALLPRIPAPWWKREKMGREGDDVWFCRKARKAGEKVGVHFGLRSAQHWGWTVLTGDALLTRAVSSLEKADDPRYASSKHPGS